MTNILNIEIEAQRSMWTFWLDALVPYRPDEVRQAFLDFTGAGTGWPNPQAIIEQITIRRRAAGIQLAKLINERKQQTEYEADKKREPKVPKEVIDKIMARFRK